MTRERCSEGWAVDKLRVMNHVKPKHRKWTPEITGMIDRDKYDETVIGPYEHGVLTDVAVNPRDDLPNVIPSIISRR